MKLNRFFNGMLAIGLTAGTLVFTATLLTSKQTEADTEALQTGQYQVSAWASYSGARIHHSGYYVIDTVTGKIVDKGHEIHGAGGPQETP